ncbi:MAG: hypothetical protein U0670_19490 [Anaerolineae bacterium]
MPSLSRLLTAFRLELRLICWNWGYALFYLLSAAWIIANYGNEQFRYSASGTVFSMSEGLIPMLMLVVIVLAVGSASRASRVRIEPLETAYPTGTEIHLGRWLAVMAASSFFLIAPLGVILALGTLETFFKLVPVFLLESLIAFAFVSLSIALVQVTIGIKRWMYPLFGLVWLASAIVPASLDSRSFPSSLLLAFASNGRLDANASELWGRLPLGNLPLFYDLFYLGAAALLIGFIGLRVHRVRHYRRSWVSTVITAVALMIVLLGARSYSLQVVEAYAQMDEQTAFLFAPGRVIPLPEEMPYRFSRYDLTLDLDDPALPRFEAQIEAVNRGETPLHQITFSLNSQLTITESTLPYQRDGSAVTLTLPVPLEAGASTSFDVHYSGALWDYGGVISQGFPLSAANFIRPDGVNLGCSAVWYPVPGSIIIGRNSFVDFRATFEDSIFRNYPDCALDEPASMTVRVQHASGLTFGSNLPQMDDATFAASTATWAHLMAAPSLVTEPISSVTLITAASLQDRFRSLVTAHYLPTLEHLRHFFPRIDGLTLFVTNSGFGNSFDPVATPLTDGRVVVVLQPYYLSALLENPFNDFLFNRQSMVSSLFGVSGGSFGTTYTDNISYFLWAHDTAQGDPGAMRLLLAEGPAQTGPGVYVYNSQTPEERYPLAQFLYQVYVDQGEEAVIDLLNRALDEAPRLNRLSLSAAQQWIEDAAHGS